MKVFEADRRFSFARRRLLQQGLGGAALSALQGPVGSPHLPG